MRKNLKLNYEKILIKFVLPFLACLAPEFVSNKLVKQDPHECDETVEFHQATSKLNDLTVTA